jgi:hypothetical protein
VANTYVLKKVPLGPALKIAFILFLIIGVIIGIFYALLISSFGFLASALNDPSLGGELGFLRGLGFVLVPVIAIFYAVFATIVVAIWVLVYNLLASVVGGIELVLERPSGASGAAAVTPPPGDSGAHVPQKDSIDGF